MNKEETYNKDSLREYLNPSRIEKAPDGFSSKTMARIMIERQSEHVRRGFFVRHRVPLISAAVTVILILSAVFIPAGDSGSLGLVIGKYFSSSHITLPQISNSYIENLAIPQWSKYGILVILFLMFFDRALNTLFHRKDTPR